MLFDLLNVDFDKEIGIEIKMIDLFYLKIVLNSF